MTLTVDTSGVASVIIQVYTVNPGVGIFGDIGWTVQGLAFPANLQEISVLANDTDVAEFTMESPAYGDAAQINIINGEICVIAVVGSNRVVTTTRLLNNQPAGVTFLNFGAVVAGTEARMFPEVNALSNWASNAKVGAWMRSDTPGTFFVRMQDTYFSTKDFPLGTVNGTDPLYAELILPQASLGVFFLPSADSATGVINVTLVEGQM